MMMRIASENDRFIYIKNCLAKGETREETAQKLGYRNWRSLDIFMRRKGLKWDSIRNIYYSADDEYCNLCNEASKIQKIISMFGNKDAEPKKIAEETGFKDHHELAVYMKANNYIWSHDIRNYIMNSVKNDNIAAEAAESCDMCDMEAEESSGHQDESCATGDISRYLPLLELLLKNIEKLKVMFSDTAPVIPRYAVSGIIRTKSFYMSDKVSRLISEYSRSRNISQKELVEAAIIEFLCKYSYKGEVNKILDSNNTL